MQIVDTEIIVALIGALATLTAAVIGVRARQQTAPRHTSGTQRPGLHRDAGRWLTISASVLLAGGLAAIISAVTLRVGASEADVSAPDGPTPTPTTSVPTPTLTPSVKETGTPPASPRSSPPPLVVPNLRGMTEQAAREELRRRGFTGETVVALGSDHAVSPGSVLLSDPAAGKTVANTAKIKLVVVRSPLGRGIDAQQGDCVYDYNPASGVDLQQVGCGTASRLVLRRFDGTTDASKCEGIAGFTQHYVLQSGSAKVVLCLSAPRP
jgi:hypothetical protein